MASTATSEDLPVLHILVIGFHHQKGTQVEFCHPHVPRDPLASDEDALSLPKVWQSLPYLAMPDGAHNFDDDYSFFHLPALSKGNKSPSETVFGVAFFRQIDSSKLKVKGHDITRSSVQKSVCILMRMPLYGFILSKLELISHAYFNECDFTQTGILVDCYDSLNLQLATMRFDDTVFHMGLSLKNLVLNFGPKLLSIVKLLLLEKRVVFWGSPVRNVCQTIISVVSLFPGLIHKGLVRSACVESEFHRRGTQTPHDEYGLPLDVFGEGCLFLPYLSLHHMSALRKPKVHCYVVGSSNVLFKQQSHSHYDALVDLENFSIHVPDVAVGSLLSLSTEDMRMCDYMISVVRGASEDVGWEGSDDWIRLQFKAYILFLLSTVGSTEDAGSLHQFNGAFCQAWVGTANYKKWAETDHPKMEHFHRGHPFQGDITVSDFRLRLNQIAESIGSEENRKKIELAVARTGQIVGGAINSAKTAVSSMRGWISGVMQEMEQEMRKHQEAKSQPSTAPTFDPDQASTEMVISERDRQGELATIGDILEKRKASR